MKLNRVEAREEENIISLNDDELQTLIIGLELIPDLHSHPVVIIYYKLSGKKD